MQRLLGLVGALLLTASSVHSHRHSNYLVKLKFDCFPTYAQIDSPFYITGHIKVGDKTLRKPTFTIDLPSGTTIAGSNPPGVVSSDNSKITWAFPNDVPAGTKINFAVAARSSKLGFRQFAGMIESRKKVVAKDTKTIQIVNLSQAIVNATNTWVATVTSNKPTAAAETAALYAADAVFLPTVSTEFRTTPAEVKSYFDYFANLPELKFINAASKVRVFPNGLGANDGYIKLSTKDGAPAGGVRLICARFSFLFRFNPVTGKWQILTHHNSIVPKRPAGLPALSPPAFPLPSFLSDCPSLQ